MPALGQRSLKGKLLKITAGIMLLMSVVMLSAVTWMNYVTERERLAEVENQITRTIWSKGATLTESHALSLKGLVTDNAFSDVKELVTRAAAQDDVVYGTFVSAEGQAWAYVSPSTRKLAADPAPDAWKELGIDGALLRSGAFRRSKVAFR
jgi:hypothetical protein